MKILRFGVENFGCFRDYTEVSFVATAQKDEPSFRIPEPRVPHGVLPVLGVYGANASGKTQLLKGLLTLRDHVRRSFGGLQPSAKIPWSPWKKTGGEMGPPTQLDVDFVLDGTRYHYGFRYDNIAFREEWLYRWETRRKQVIFERTEDPKSPWYFGSALGGNKAFLAAATRPNSLFLSAAAQHNHELLGSVHRAISEGIREDLPILHEGVPLFPEGSPILSETVRSTVEALLRALDVGCIGFQSEKIHITGVAEGLSEILKPEALEQVRRIVENGQSFFRLSLLRRAADGSTWSLPPELESRGTLTLLQRINDLLGMGEGVLVVDELETSLHPEVSAAILALFSTEQANPRGFQLLFSTHNRDLLLSLRRDEVLLVDKAPEGHSTVTSAAAFRGLRGRDDLRRAYEAGRVGGVPILGSVPALWEAGA